MVAARLTCQATRLSSAQKTPATVRNNALTDVASAAIWMNCTATLYYTLAFTPAMATALIRLHAGRYEGPGRSYYGPGRHCFWLNMFRRTSVGTAYRTLTLCLWADVPFRILHLVLALPLVFANSLVFAGANAFAAATRTLGWMLARFAAFALVAFAIAFALFARLRAFHAGWHGAC